MEQTLSMVSEIDPDEEAKKPAIITVTAMSLEAPPWVCFSMAASYPQKGGKQDGEILEFDEAAGAFDLQFNLVDNTNPKLKLAFYPSVADAIWVTVGGDEPTGPGYGDGAIVPGDVNKSKNKLIVTNNNAVGQTLTFTLRFTGNYMDEDHPPYVYDPKIVNGGDPPLTGEDDDGDDRPGEGEG